MIGLIGGQISLSKSISRYLYKGSPQVNIFLKKENIIFRDNLKDAYYEVKLKICKLLKYLLKHILLDPAVTTAEKRERTKQILFNYVDLNKHESHISFLQPVIVLVCVIVEYGILY